MPDKEFYKRFEELLNEIFGGRKRPMTPMDTFLDNLNNNQNGDDFGKWRKYVRTPKDGVFTSIYFTINGDKPNKEWSAPEKESVDELHKQLNECIKSQNFEEAAKLRDKIIELKDTSTKITKLKKELEIVISEQNFERAIEIRDELKRIN